MKLSIAKKLSIVFCLIIITVIITISLVAYHILSRQIVDEIIKRLTSISTQTIQVIDRTMFERLTDVEALAHDKDTFLLEEDEVVDAIEYLREFEKTRKLYASMSLYDVKGIKLGDTRGLLIGIDESNKPFFKSAMQGEIFNDPKPVTSQSLGIHVMHFSAPIRNYQGEIAGVLVARFTINKLNDILKETLGQETENDLRVNLLDKDGLILFSNWDRGSILSEKLQGFEAVKKLISQEAKNAYSYTTQENESNRLCVVVRQKGYLNYKGNDWMLHVSVDKKTLLKPLYKLGEKIFFVSVFLMLIVIGVIIFVSKKISTPLEKLTRATQEIGQKGFSQASNIDIATEDEVGQLAGAFNNMVNNLKHMTASRDDLDKEIKKRQQVEESLRISEQQSRSIIETATDAFISIDVGGFITDWNRQAESVLGWMRLEVIGKSLAETIIPPQYREAHKNGLKHFMATGQGPVVGKTVELSALRRDGKEFPIEITIWPIQIKESYQFNAFLRDISKRKEAENELKKINQELSQREKEIRQTLTDLQKTHDELKRTQNQLLQSEKLASIGQLAAGVAHEINNPVGFINNNMEILGQYITDYGKILRMVNNLKTAIDEDNLEKAKSMVQEMAKFEQEINLDYIINDINNLLQHNQRGIERIQKIVLDLRTFAREDTDTLDLIKIEEVIDSILSIVHNELKYKAELKKSYGDTPLVNCNPQRLGQVFINLLVNAVQAIEEKGTIEVKTYKQDKFVCVDIIDTGKGIEEKNLKKIFDPFFTTKPIGQGTGLGLSVSYEIIKKHGGEIKVWSKVGEGTIFTVTLPVT